VGSGNGDFPVKGTLEQQRCSRDWDTERGVWMLVGQKCTVKTIGRLETWGSVVVLQIP